LKRKLAVVCLGYLAAVILVALIAPLALPGVASQQAGNLLEVRQGPSWQHPLGTDTLGRDVLDRLLVGTRVTMIGVVEALVVALALGVPLGLMAGYFGGRLDRAVSALVDVAYSIPGIIVVLVVLSVFPQSMLAGMTMLGVLASPDIIRIVRSAVFPVKQELYIAAARVSGLSRPYIITRHVVPRISGVIIVQASLLAAAALLVQSGLAFLGLLVAAPAPSWGGMVADGLGVLLLDPWLIWPPGVVIAVTIVAFGLLGDVVRDANTEGWSTPVRRVRRRSVGKGRARIASVDHDVRPETGSLLDVSGLSVAFTTGAGSDVTVVQDVSFTIQRGEILGVIGESGCGKTATAMSIIGLLPGTGRVTSGRIRFDGRDLTRSTEAQMRRIRGREIALISQEPMTSLNPVFRVGWQLREVVKRHQALPRGAAEARVLDLLRQVELPDPAAVARSYPHELSGGMAQRVAIARALAGEPKLLIADEPTTALDVTVQAEILHLLRALQAERGMSILMISHNWGVIADSCDRVVVMYAGQVVEQASTASLFHQPLHPYTEALHTSNPHNAPEAQELPSIPGSVPTPGDWPAGCHFHPRCPYATKACTEAPIALVRPASGRETRCIHHEKLVSAEARV
jgi:peptide/nickel transport system permease protein